ncbi:phage tail protein [Cellulosilyticum lentocellum]|uniref:Tail tape measure protein TP901 core region n=1 Tax=Cellulosilyticum lentocellum (strain ATCC 49066 / DSM 5427 / NCIMB 11756 / RHM5) TaxID=642492 RepID=F2JPD7_CELLD|nr:tail tape measure protein TP901 core region [Cellulosilyticum lentocellum]ADZ82485.1 tail tape measure protein TP901 core region [Cellulosilyticum lentocellum DSM 5427]
MNIFTLMGTILIDNSNANESISKTGKESDGLANKLGTGLKSAAGLAVKGIAVLGTSAVAAGASLLGMANNAAETADRVDKLSAKIGISKTAFQEWDYIMGQNGMDVEKLQVGVKTLVNQMDSAAGGGKAAQEAFQKLGVTWTDGNGKLKSQEQMLQETITALAEMGDGAERAKLASTLLGKAGVEMAPMLNTGAEGIEQLRQRAHDLNLVMSDEAVNAGVVLGDTMDDVKKSFGAIMTRIGVEVMPVIQKLLDLVINNMPVIQSMIMPVFEFLKQFFSVSVELIGNLVSSLKDTLVPAFQTIYDFIITNWPTIQATFEAVFGAIGAILQPIVENFNELVPILAGVLAGMIAFEVISGISALWTAFTTAITAAQTAITAAGGAQAFLNGVLAANPIGLVCAAIAALVAALIYLYNNNEEVRRAIDEAWKAIQECFQVALDFIMSLINSFVEAFKQFWQEYGDNIMAVAQAIWDYIAKIFKTAFDAIKDVFNIFAKAFKGDWEGVWEGVKTFVTNLWNNLKEVFKAWLNVLVSFVTNIGPILKDAAVGAFNLLWDGAKAVWETLKTWFSDMLDGIVSTITGIGQSLFDAGKSIFTYLWNGIKQKWDEICSWVSDKVNWLADKLTFWDNGKKKMAEEYTTDSTDGSHSAGLKYVPFDNYVANLHEGEMVLTRTEAESYRKKEETTRETSNNSTDTTKMEDLLKQVLNALITLPKRQKLEQNMA